MSASTRRGLGVAGLLGVGLAGSAASEDWPMFRSDAQHSGMLRNGDASPISPRRLWSYVIPEGITFSSPVVHGGSVYIGSNFSSDCKARGRVYAFDVATGRLRWSFATAGAIGDAAAAVLGGTVVIGGGDTVYGLDATTGLVRWSRPFPGFCFQENFVTAVPSRGLVFLAGLRIQGQLGYIFAFTVNGEGWFAPQQVAPSQPAGRSPTFSAPTHVEGAGLLVFGTYDDDPASGTFAGTVRAISDGDGTPRWINTSPAGRVYATPAYDPGRSRLYVGSFDGRLYALDLSGATQWSYLTGGRIVSSAAIVASPAGKRIVVGSEDGHLYALRENGQLAWKFDAGSPIYASVAVGGAGGGGVPHLYVATADGDLLVLDANGQLVPDPHVPAPLADGLTWSSPALADRRIFIASSDLGRPSHFFILGDRPLTAGGLRASREVRTLDVGSPGDLGTGAPERGVSLWSVGEQWGAPTLLDGRSVRKALVAKPRFVVNLGQGPVDLARPWVLKLHYRSRHASHVHQYDGSAYHRVATLPGGGVWRVARVMTRPDLYGDYPDNAGNGLNVLFAIATSDAEFYVDSIELRPWGDVDTLDVGADGDMQVDAHLPGVSLWPIGAQWGDPRPVDERTVRSAQVIAPRLTMNLPAGSGDLALPFELSLVYRADRTAYVYQYDGTRYHLIATLPGDGTWRTGRVVTRPEWYADYQGQPANGVNVLFAIAQSGSAFDLDRIEMKR